MILCRGMPRTAPLQSIRGPSEYSRRARPVLSLRRLQKVFALSPFDIGRHSATKNMYGAPCFTIPKLSASGATLVNSQVDSESGAVCGRTMLISFSSTPANGNLIVLLTNDNTGSGPTGFTGFTAATGNADACRLFYKKASSETNSYSYSYNGSAGGDASILQGFVFSGIFSTVFDLSDHTANSLTTPTITTTHLNDLVITCGGSQSAIGAFATAPSGTTLIRHDSINGISVGSAWKTQATAAATGTFAWNASTYTVAHNFTIGFRTV